jgi:putative transposase
LIVGFIDEYRQVYGVESICRALPAHGVQIAPKPCRKARHRPASARDVTDTQVENTLRDLQNTPEAMYGRRKMTRYLRRQGHEVAFCTVDRLMRELSLNGVVRGRRHRTTIPGKDGIRAGDKLNRDFTAASPNEVWVADFTYVSTWTGWAYAAFVFDAYSRAIVGWTVASSKTTAMVTKALNMAVWRRDPSSPLVQATSLFSAQLLSEPRHALIPSKPRESRPPLYTAPPHTEPTRGDFQGQVASAG